MSIGHLLNRTVNVWRKSETADGAGGVAVVWQLQGTAKARFSQPSPSERAVAAQEGVEVTHDVYLPSDTTVVRGDRLVDDVTVEVVSVVAPSVASHHRKARGRQEPWDEPVS